MKTALIACAGAATAALLSMFLLSMVPVQAEPALLPASAEPAVAANQSEMKHVGMGENQPL
jgi:hypothetical protein